ncbi:MAG: hypothetical protein ACQCN5_01725 [Candidatus Bathyarchaeia archaeon]|jgi:hypothetical protein
MRRHVYLLVLIFAFACLIRFYPALISGLPFSTDGWSIIRNSELLIQYTPVSLSSSVFDGYNSFWPASSLFGAVVSEVTGVSPVDVLAYGVPFASALTVPLFFVLVRKISGNLKVALISSVLIATAYPYVLFTSGVTKETFANPFFAALLLVFLMQPSMGRNLLFGLFSVALVLTHHLSAFIALAVLGSLLIGFCFSRKDGSTFSLRSGVFLLLFFAALLMAYFGLYAHAGLSYAFLVSDFINIGAYQVLVFSLVLFFVFKPSALNMQYLTFRKRLVFSILTLVLVFLCAAFVTQRSIVGGAPVLPFHYLFYLSPYFVLFPSLFFISNNLSERKRWLLFPAFWMVPLFGLECYAVFGGSPFGLTLVVRLLNFLVLPLCILFGLAFGQIHAFFKDTPKKKIVAVGLVTTLLAVSCVNCYSVYASVSLQEPYMGYFWLYRLPEDAACRWISLHIGNQPVAGDIKMAYFLGDYYNVTVDSSTGLSFLGQDGSPPDLLIVYPEMSTNGYVIYGGTALPLPDSYETKLSSLNHVYSNNMVNLYGS